MRSTTRCATSRPSTRSVSSSRTRSRSTTSTSRSTRCERVAELGGKSLQLPVFPTELGFADYFDERYDPLWARDPGHRPPDLLPHRPQHRARRPGQRRDPTPQKGDDGADGRDVDRRGARHVDLTGVLERFPDLKVVFVEPGLGWVAWYLYIIDDMVTRQNYELPGHHRAARASTSTATCSSRSSTSPTRCSSLRHRLGVETSCGRPTTRTRCRAGRTRATVAAQCVAALPEREHELITSGNRSASGICDQITR